MDMNNEPVAWMQVHYKDGRPTKFSKVQTWEDDIPLYTHPAKELDEQFKKGFEAGKEEGWKAHKFHHPAKTLTDEEILNLFEPKYDVEIDDEMIIEFARAILRKAQEK